MRRKNLVNVKMHWSWQEPRKGQFDTIRVSCSLRHEHSTILVLLIKKFYTTLRFTCTRRWRPTYLSCRPGCPRRRCYPGAAPRRWSCRSQFSPRAPCPSTSSPCPWRRSHGDRPAGCRVDFRASGTKPKHNIHSYILFLKVLCFFFGRFSR